MKTKAKMIVVWGENEILSSSIQHFLAPQDNWNVISISNKEDLYALVLEEEYTNLYIVIIPQSDDDSKSYLPMQLLQDHPAIKVIIININSNMMDIYSKQTILVNQASDLLKVLENEA